MNFGDIEDALLFVSSQPEFFNTAYLCKETGKIYYNSEYGDSDELPDDIEDDEKYVEIPHKNHLRPGKNLALEFTLKYLPGDIEKIAGRKRR